METNTEKKRMKKRMRAWVSLLKEREQARVSLEKEREKARVSMDKEREKELVMLRRYGEVRSKDVGVPRACDCGAAVSVQTSNDPTTRRMQFLKCPYEISDGRGEGCGFRRVFNQAILDEFEKIRQDKFALQRSLDAANEKIEELETRVSASEDDGSLERGLIDANWKLDVMMDKYGELAKKYEMTESKYELSESKYEKLNK